jgi:hypothetical protein
MGRFVPIMAMLGIVAGMTPCWAVLQSTALVVTDQGHAIPGATIVLSRPHPRAAHGPVHQAQPTQTSRSAPAPAPASTSAGPQTPPQAPAASGPAEGNWAVVRSDESGRAVFRLDDRDAPPDTLVNVTLYYPNGLVRQRYDVPIETIFAGGVLEITGGATPPAWYSPPLQPMPLQPTQPPPPEGAGVFGIVPSFGVEIGGGGHGGHHAPAD